MNANGKMKEKELKERGRNHVHFVSQWKGIKERVEGFVPPGLLKQFISSLIWKGGK
jgi:hypothetical protein